MAMKTCKDCGTKVSKNARTCPNCGRDQRNILVKHKIILHIMIIFFISFIIVLAINNL